MSEGNTFFMTELAPMLMQTGGASVRGEEPSALLCETLCARLSTIRKARLHQQVRIVVEAGVAAKEVAQGSAVAMRLTSLPPTPSASHQPAAIGNLFRREGEYWTLMYHGVMCHLKDTKGLHYLAALVRDPGREFHVAELTT